MSSPPVAINMSLCRKLPFDTTRDLATIAVFSQTPNTIANIPSVIEFVRAGRLRALASTTVERTALFAQIPTMREAGVDMVVNVWYTPHAPAATPRDIVQRIAAVTVKAARSPDIIRRLADMGAELVGYMPEDAARFLRNEIALWTTVVKASGAQAD